MNKTMKPRGVVKIPPRELSEEEKKNQVIQYLVKKREEYSVHILQGLCANPELFKQEIGAEILADMAVKTADKLMEKLYPLPKEEEK